MAEDKWNPVEDAIKKHEKKKLEMVTMMASCRRYPEAVTDAAWELYDAFWDYCVEKFGLGTVAGWNEEFYERFSETREVYLKNKKKWQAEKEAKEEATGAFEKGNQNETDNQM